MPPPALSAVLVTRDRADLLRGALEGLCRQTLARSAFEVVLIDNGSADGTRDVAADFRPRLPLRYSRRRGGGVSPARNHGISLARGRILLFLDDGEVAGPDLLQAHFDAHARFPEPHVAVLGYAGLDPALAEDPAMRYATRVGWDQLSYSGLSAGAVLGFAGFRVGRTSCKRDFLVAHGVFEADAGCEDVELGFRLSRHGLQVLYEPRAISTIVRRLGFDELCRRSYETGWARMGFRRLHDDPAVEAWTGVREGLADWPKAAPLYEAMLRSGRELDRLARLRRAGELTLDDETVALLHRGYERALRASRVKGMADRAAEPEAARPSPRATPAASPRPPAEPEPGRRPAGGLAALLLGGTEKLELQVVRSREEYRALQERSARAERQRRLIEEVIALEPKPLRLRGYNALIASEVDYLVDERERVTCAVTGLCGPVRAAILAAQQLVGVRRFPSCDVHVTEQGTPAHAFLRSLNRRTVGSEDLRAASAATDGFDVVLSCGAAGREPLRELFRVTKPGGFCVLAAPAEAPPQESFGLLDELRDAGFAEAGAFTAWSAYHGLIGPDQLVFFARKADGPVRTAGGLPPALTGDEEEAALAQNAAYDAQTVDVMRRVLRPDSSCVDVGCHAGAILDHMLELAPRGRHFAFEPLPDLAARLKSKYAGFPGVDVRAAALAERRGRASFHHVTTNPGYSGLQRRRYPSPGDAVVEIEVDTERLDDVVPASLSIAFVKIDVEGGELGVLRGGLETIRRCRPVIVFEHQRGAADCYGTRPADVHALLHGECGLAVSLMSRFLDGEPPLGAAELVERFERDLDFYFIAYPES